MITIDGSLGEGGGQILRTSLSLAAILTQPVRIVNIRAGRKQPGLRPQHVESVKAAATICNAWLEGAKEHSRELLFEPQTPPQPGTYVFNISTAGAATLLLQTVLVPLALAGGPSRVTVRGGTHVSWSPSFDYVQQVYLPALASLGFHAELKLVKWGFYPKGGGEIAAAIRPVDEPAPSGLLTSAPAGLLTESAPVGAPAPAGDSAPAGLLTESAPAGDSAPAGLLTESAPVGAPALADLRPSLAPPWTRLRGELVDLSVLSAATNVGNQVTARQASQAYNRLAAARFQAKTSLLNPPSAGPGTCVFVLAEYEGGARAGFTGYGRQGYPAERVADDAVDSFLNFHKSGAPVDPHLADQLILPLSLTAEPLSYQTSEITQHLLTNVWVVAQFLGQRFEVDGEEGQPGEVRYGGRS